MRYGFRIFQGVLTMGKRGLQNKTYWHIKKEDAEKELYEMKITCPDIKDKTEMEERWVVAPEIVTEKDFEALKKLGFEIEKL